MKKEASKIILMNQEQKILMYLRDNIPSISYPDNWDFIGGGLEEGENALEAALREAKEEISCPVTDLKQIGEIDSEQNDSKLFIFTGKIFAYKRKIKLYEGRKIGYFNFDDLFNIKTPQFYKDFLKDKKKLLV